jgi:hypothetical protein
MTGIPEGGAERRRRDIKKKFRKCIMYPLLYGCGKVYGS